MGVFEFLFKYPANLYRQGTVQLEQGWITYALAGALAVLAAVTLAQYLSRSLPLRRTDRLILAGLRAAWVAMLVLMLCAPVLTVTVAQTLRGDVVLLLDDSQSMRIADTAGMTRGARLRELFAPGDGELSRALEERFTVHHVGFGLNAGRIAGNSALTFAAPRSDLAGALEHARTRLQGATLGAVVLVSDGGAALSDDLQSELLAYRAAGIAVHTVGIGAPRFSSDLELASVSVPERLFPGDLLRAEVTLHQRGAAGRQLTLQVTEDGVLLHRQAFEVAHTHSFTLPVTVAPLKAPGTHRLSFAVTPDADDQLPANNRLDVPVQLASAPVQVLHFEGEPRFEVKFIRRAVRDDPSLQVASLIRTAENKYYRVGVADAEQLLTGFPEEPAALFGFDVIVLGSVAANLLNAAQQQLLKDYVARRGGALLLLGARQAFAEGGYAASELSGLLPVRLQEKQSGFRTRVSVTPTAIGALHPVVQALSLTAPDDGLPALPALTLVNPLLAVKPGATVLLEGDDGGPEPFVVLAYQRYGRGTVAVLATRDTWRWQMHSSVASDDMTHETLWRELLRWLARPVRPRIELQVHPAYPVPGEQLRITATALDTGYQPLPAADLRLAVTTPLGDRHTLGFSPRPGGNGSYEAVFTALEPGLHELEATLGDEADPAVRRAAVEVLPAGEEFRGAELNEPLLRHIAAATGGRYFRSPEAGGLDRAVADVQGDTRIEKRLPLYDTPALFVMLVVLIGAEWFYRRRRGLA